MVAGRVWSFQKSFGVPKQLIKLVMQNINIYKIRPVCNNLHPNTNVVQRLGFLPSKHEAGVRLPPFVMFLLIFWSTPRHLTTTDRFFCWRVKRSELFPQFGKGISTESLAQYR